MSSTFATARYARLRPRARAFVVLLGALLLAGGMRALDVNPASAQTVTLPAYEVDGDPGTDPDATPWQDVPSIEVPLSAQTVTFPTGGGMAVETPAVTARAVHDQDTLYIAVSWPDATVDDSTAAAEAFADAAAVQFPGEPSSTVPAVCMGQADESVNIWHWRADSETGPPEVPESGYVDLYPSTDDRQYPARAAGNPYAQPEGGAVQNLVAGGFGTLAPADGQAVDGHSSHDGERWTVVFARDYAAPGGFQPTFADGQVIDVAFAVWDGALDQRDGIKSVSSFAQLELTDDAVPVSRPLLSLSVAMGLIVVIVLAVRRDRVASWLRKGRSSTLDAKG